MPDAEKSFLIFIDSSR
jgi:hypothetical protein